MDCLLRCLRTPNARAPVAETITSVVREPVNELQASPRPRASASDEQSRSSSKAQDASAQLIQAINGVFAKLGDVSGDYSLYSRIGVLLETCRCALGVYDVRLACFSEEGATWVFLPSLSAQDTVPVVAGWGYSILYRILEENVESVAVLLGYHALALQLLRPRRIAHPRILMTSAAAPATAPAGSMAAAVTPSTTAPRALSAGLSQLEVSTAHQNLTSPSVAPAAVPPPPPATCRVSPPEQFAVSSCAVSEAVRLMPGDLLALPVRMEGRLTAALLVGWERPPSGASSMAAAAAPASSSSASMLHPNKSKSGLRNGVKSGGGSSSSSSSAFELSPNVTAHLERLAQFLVFGLMCDSQQRRSMTQLAQRFALLPAASSLHDFITALLESVTGLLHMKFSVRLQPIFLLTHGVTTGGPAVLFSPRVSTSQQQPGGQTGEAAPTSTGGARAVRPNSLEAWSSGPGGTQGTGSVGSMMQQQSSGLAGLRAEDSANNVVVAGEGPSRVRAVRISLHHTLLAEALRASSTFSPAMTTVTSQPVPTQRRTNASSGDTGTATGGTAASTGLAVGVGGGRLLGVTSAVSSNFGGQGILSAADLPRLDSTTAIGIPASPGVGGTAEGPAAAEAAASEPLPPPPSPSIHTTVVPNFAAHMLKEGAPCRDLLLCSNLANCGTTGSLVLAVEAPMSAATTSYGSPAGGVSALAAASFLASVGGATATAADAASNLEMGRTNSSSAATGHAALSALSQPLLLLHSQRQFGMYVVCPEVLPEGLLEGIAEELKQLLSMALSSCRDRALSVLNGGRCAWELYYLQEELLGLNSGNVGSVGGSLVSSLATVFAAANATSASASVTPPMLLHSGALASMAAIAAGTGQAAASMVSAAAGVGSGGVRGILETLAASAPGGMPSPHVLSAGRKGGTCGPAGRRLPRPYFANVAASSSLSASGIRSAGCPRFQPSQMEMAVEAATDGLSTGRNLEQQLHESPAADGRLLTERTGSTFLDDGIRWMLASSPEVMLERQAVGPSPLKVMVSFMRSGLTAALTNAVLNDGESEGARAMLSQELAALRLYDVIGRGGQGVIFYGTLHGLETAVKVIVHRGKGEPLAHDGGDLRIGAGADEGGADAGGDGAVGLAAPEEAGGEGPGDLSRIRKAQRGALELVVTGALSHPNIVQVLASFSDVIMVRCTYRNEPAPKLRLVAKDDPILASWTSPGPLNTVVCLEYCDGGTLLEAAHSGAFRPAGSSVLSGAVRPALVPLYMSLLEVALALRYLHSRRLVHCDLKPANVLLKSSTRDPRRWTCKLSDFGCVRLMTELAATAEDMQRPLLKSRRVKGSSGSGASPVQQHNQQQPDTIIGFRVAQPLGTIAYMAPESFVRGQTLCPSIDIYAFGILMYELLMCRSPYNGMDAQMLPRLVLRQHLRPEFHPLAPPEYCHLAARCWSSHVSRRPTAGQLVNELETLLSNAHAKESRKVPRAAAAAAASLASAVAARPPSPQQPPLSSGPPPPPPLLKHQDQHQQPQKQVQADLEVPTLPLSSLPLPPPPPLLLQLEQQGQLPQDFPAQQELLERP